MNTTRIVLMQPFVRFPASQVLEVAEQPTMTQWASQDHFMERGVYAQGRVWQLPDGGNGLPVELPVYDTLPCPDAVFEGVDLTTGPCRVTGSFVYDDGWQATDLKYQINLLDINGIKAHGIEIPLKGGPKQAQLHDALREVLLMDMNDGQASFRLNLSALMPGFYRLELRFSHEPAIQIRLFKSFPLHVILQKGRNGFETTPAIW